MKKIYLLYFIGSFVIRFWAGFYSTIFDLASKILYLFAMTKPLTLDLLNFAPRPNFLSDVATFEAVVISIAIPVSFEIISRISERYESDILTRRFAQEWVVKQLPIYLIINIVLAITLRFFVKDEPASALWKPLAWLTFLGFLFVATVLFKFLRLTKGYMTEIEFILRRLFDEAEKSLK